MILARLQAGLVVAVACLIASGFFWQIRDRTKLRAEAARQATDAAKLAALEKEVAAETARAAAAESSVDAALQSAKMAYSALTIAPDTSGAIDAEDALKATLAHAEELLDAGKPQEALDEYVKCYRELQAILPGSPSCQNLMRAILHLGRSYPAALSSLAALRDSAVAQLQAQPGRSGLPFEIALLNKCLGEVSRTVALYDSLAPNDVAARQTLAHHAHDSFVAARRYTDALLGRSFGQMLTGLELGSLRPEMRETAVENTLTNIEILTGAGKLDDARMLTEKLLAFDRSDATRTKLQHHLDRAHAPKP